MSCASEPEGALKFSAGVYEPVIAASRKNNHHDSHRPGESNCENELHTLEREVGLTGCREAVAAKGFVGLPRAVSGGAYGLPTGPGTSTGRSLGQGPSTAMLTPAPAAEHAFP